MTLSAATRRSLATAGAIIALVMEGASLLIVAALFQPLRRRVHSVVDRCFNRSRYAAIRTVVAQTVAPTSVGLWVRERGRS